MRGIFRKTRVNEVSSIIDALAIARRGIPVTGTMTSTVSVTFSYSLSQGGTVIPCEYPVAMESTRCHFGGRRWWFICPLAVNGTPCLRRCRFLYLPPGQTYYGCRECYDLTYESRQRHRESHYEGYIRPMKAADRWDYELYRARSPEARALARSRLLQAQAILDLYFAGLRG